jgi:hypothetical protein
MFDLKTVFIKNSCHKHDGDVSFFATRFIYIYICTGTWLKSQGLIFFFKFISDFLSFLFQFFKIPIYRSSVDFSGWLWIKGKLLYIYIYIIFICITYKEVHPITAHEGPKGQYRYGSTLSVTSALDGVGGQRHAPAVLPLGKTLYPLYRRVGWPQRGCGRVRKISPPPGFDPEPSCP